MSKKTIIVVVALLAALLTVGIASADTIAGRGWISAEGRGSVLLNGNVARLTITGNGSLLFKDEGEPDEPRVAGFERVIHHPNGWVEYIGVRGVFHLEDADQVTVKMTGRRIDLFAAGKGRVELQGRGHYTYGIGDRILGGGNWAEDGVSQEFSD